jgi:hypothetical protein
MAKIDDNIIMEGIRGRLGKRLVYRKTRGGTTIVSTRPSFNETREFTDEQLDQQGAFKQAVAYAKKAKTQPAYKKLARGTEMTSFNVAVADWFSHPEVTQIDPSGWTGEVGQTIFIEARDDVLVSGVTLSIQDSNGNILEQGAATLSDNTMWSYTTTSQIALSSIVQVVATALDLAGNTGELAWTND